MLAYLKTLFIASTVASIAVPIATAHRVEAVSVAPSYVFQTLIEEEKHEYHAQSTALCQVLSQKIEGALRAVLKYEYYNSTGSAKKNFCDSTLCQTDRFCSGGNTNSRILQQGREELIADRFGGGGDNDGADRGIPPSRRAGGGGR